MKVSKRSGSKSAYKQSINNHDIFDGACKEFFGDNVYHTWCELIFHLILTFVSIWHDGIYKLEVQFKEATNGLKKKLKNPLSESIFFLYQDIFTKKIGFGVSNIGKISDYQKTL
jgi:hypothetical protein